MPKYKLKKDEKWEDEALYHPPHYCTNCGKSMRKPQSYWVDSSRPSTPDNPFRGVGYDCYCEHCHWFGEINPGADSCVVEKRVEFLSYSEVFKKKEKQK